MQTARIHTKRNLHLIKDDTFRRVSTCTVLVMVLVIAIIEFAETITLEKKLIALFIFWLYAMLFGIADYRNRFAYIIFVFMIYTFLLSRPFLALVYGVKWKYWSHDTIDTAFKLVFVSLVALLFAAGCVSLFGNRYTRYPIVIRNENNKVLKSYAVFLLVISGIAFLYLKTATLLSYKNLGYASLYLDHGENGAYIIRALSAMFPLALPLYLALMPSKKNTFFALLLYIVSGIPLFLLGNRASLVLPIVFAVVYIMIRAVVEKDKTKWITKRAALAFCVFSIGAVFVLGVMNYTRDHRTVLDDAKMPLMADFFYKQGTTFDTVCQGIEYRDRIEALPGEPVYTFSGITDTLKSGRIGRLIDNSKALPSGNSIDIVTKRSSLAHRLSYIVMGNEYLTGHGRGSSYLIENFLDWGYLGVFIFSFMIGLLLSSIVPVFRRSNFIVRMVLLSCLMQIFIIPRAEATSFVSFLFAPYFWLLLISCVVLLVVTDTNNESVLYKG